MFPTQTYVSRRAALRKLLPASGIALFLGNEESPMNYSANTFHFRQDSHFLYFFGISAAGLGAIMDLDAGTDVIYGDELTMEDIVWTGPLPSLKDRAAAVGVGSTAPSADLPAALAKAKAAGRSIHFLPPYRPENKIKLLDWLGIAPSQAKVAASEAFIKAVVELRSVKSAEEIAEIEKGVDVTGAMHLAAMRCARPGMTEAQVWGEVMKAVSGADSHVSFNSIITRNGQVLHNHAHHNTLHSGDLLLVDCGGESPLFYAGDMTRTFPVDRTFTQRQKDVYEIVLASQVAACEAIKPGIAYRDVHLLAARVIAEGMKSLGLMKGSTEDAVAAGAHALFFVHGLGHMMGLDVHDMEDLGEAYVGYGEGFERSKQFGTGFLRMARTLRPGFVVTVEPGVYFIPELTQLWKAEGKFTDFIDYDKVEQYLDFGGIRIEEDYLVTETSGRRLGQAVAKTVAEVEAVRG
jgi:Xaa-Pro aminopeptidase